MTDKYAMRGPPRAGIGKPRLRFQVEPGQTSTLEMQAEDSRKEVVVRNLQQEPSTGNPSQFVGTVGKFGPRETAYGPAIDIADNNHQPCLWYDVVPKNPEILTQLQQGTSVLVVVHGLLEGSWGYHPTISSTLQWLPDVSYPTAQLRLC